MARFATFLLRLAMSNPTKRAAKVKELSKLLKDQGLGNNNTKRAEAAELIIQAFTGHVKHTAHPHTRKPKQDEAPEVLGKSDIAKH